MAVCGGCGEVMEGERKLCPPCTQQKVDSIWKRQMRNYSVAIVIGALLLLLAIYQVRSLPHMNGASSMPLSIIGEAALGGLGLLGGLFGLALALFFHIWHKKKSD